MKRFAAWLAVVTPGLYLSCASAALADDHPCPRDDAGPQRDAVRQANQSADSAADRLNRSIVGNQQQNENERAAQAARPGDCADQGQKNQGARDERGVRGSTSMQPNGAADQVGQSAADTTGGVEGAVRDVTRSTDHPGHYIPLAIEVDPLGLFIGGRFSLNAEWAPAVHHAIEVSPHVVHTTADVATSGNTSVSQAFSGVGTELGYRYYTGHRGMNGVFLGPSLVLGFYNAGLPNGNQAFTDVGVAADVGVQEILWNHLVVGGGAGLEYLSVSHDFGDLPTGPSTIASSGIKPRLLLEAGYGF